MQNKILAIFFAVVVMQLLYFLIKSTKNRLYSGNTFLKGREYIRGIIVFVLLAILLIFMFL